METIFEKLGGRYQQEGGYLLPNIEVPESPQIGIWGQRRLQYLRTSQRVLYTTMLMGGTLKDHLEEADQSANKMFDLLVAQLKTQEGVTIDAHPFDAGDGDCETVLDQLYQAYAETHESDPAEISDDLKELEEFLCILPLEDNNAVFTLCCRLCSAYEHKAFVDGLLYGS